MICGVYFTNMSSSTKTGEFKWEENLFKSNHIIEQLTSLITNFLIIIGILLLLIYTGYGLGALPFFLIKGVKSITSKGKEVSNII